MKKNPVRLNNPKQSFIPAHSNSFPMLTEIVGGGFHNACFCTTRSQAFNTVSASLCDKKHEDTLIHKISLPLALYPGGYIVKESNKRLSFGIYITSEFDHFLKRFFESSNDHSVTFNKKNLIHDQITSYNLVDQNKEYLTMSVVSDFLEKISHYKIVFLREAFKTDICVL